MAQRSETVAPSEFRRVRAPKTAELVAGALRSQLIRGEVADGHALPAEAELMSQFGVSRPTLREAFRILESEQLLSIQRGARGGARLHVPSSEMASRYAGFILQTRGTTLRDVWEARAVIEPTAARMLADRGTEDDFVQLNAALDAEASVIEDRHLYPKASAAFHNRIIDLTANETLRLFGEMTVELMAAVNLEAVAHSHEDGSGRGPASAFRSSHKTHQRLVQLVEARNADGAETFWRKHMEVADASRDAEVGNRLVDVVGPPDGGG